MLTLLFFGHASLRVHGTQHTVAHTFVLQQVAQALEGHELAADIFFPNRVDRSSELFNVKQHRAQVLHLKDHAAHVRICAAVP